MKKSSTFSAALTQIRRNLVTVMSSTVIAGLIGLATLAVNTRVLGVAEIGTIAAVQGYALLVAGLLTLSTQLPLMQMGTQAIERDAIPELYALVRYALVLDLLMGITAVVAVGLCVGPVGEWLGIGTYIREGLAFFALAMLFSTFASSNGLLRLIDRFDLLRTIEVSGALSLFVAVVVLGALEAPLDYYLAAYALVFGATACLRYLSARLALSRRYPRPMSRETLSSEQRRSFFRFALNSSFAVTIETVRNNGDVVAVSSLFGREAMGVYAVAKQAAGAIRKFSGFTSLVSFVEMNRLIARGETAESRRVFEHLLKVCAFVGGIAFLTAIVVGEMALRLAFGPTYAEGYWILVILVAAAGIQFVMNPVSMFVQIDRGAFVQMMCNLAGFVVFAASLVPLAMWVGPEGVAVASVLFFLVATLASAWLIRPAEARAGPGTF